MNSELFSSFLSNSLAPLFQDTERKLLNLDSCKVHEVGSVRKAALSHNFDLLIIPPGCTKYLQPLDLTVNRSFKAMSRKHWVEDQWTEYKDIEINKFCKQACKAWDAVKRSVMINGFKEMCRFLDISPSIIGINCVNSPSTSSNLQSRPSIAGLNKSLLTDITVTPTLPKANQTRQEKTYEKASKALNLYQNGSSIEEIRVIFGLKSIATVYRYLSKAKKPTEAGKRIGRPLKYTDEEVAFIKEKSDEMTQQELARVFNIAFPTRSICQQVISCIIARLKS